MRIIFLSLRISAKPQEAQDTLSRKTRRCGGRAASNLRLHIITNFSIVSAQFKLLWSYPATSKLISIPFGLLSRDFNWITEHLN